MPNIKSFHVNKLIMLERELLFLGLLEKAKRLQQRLNQASNLINQTSDADLLNILRKGMPAAHRLETKHFSYETHRIPY